MEPNKTSIFQVLIFKICAFKTENPFFYWMLYFASLCIALAVVVHLINCIKNTSTKKVKSTCVLENYDKELLPRYKPSACSCASCKEQRKLADYLNPIVHVNGNSANNHRQATSLRTTLGSSVGGSRNASINEREKHSRGVHYPSK